MLLRRLIYLSRTERGLRDLDIQQMCGTAAVLHRRHDLSGILAFTGVHFLQVIEGPGDAVAHLLDLLLADPRLEGLHVFCDEVVTHRRFDHWTPIFVESLDVIDEVERAFAERTGGCRRALYLTERILQTHYGSGV